MAVADNQDSPRIQNQHLPANRPRNPRQPTPAAASPAAAAANSSDSDDPVPQNVADEDEAGDMVGVSMSRAQTRMKARSTPAEEKNRIMERNGGYFETIPDYVQSDGLYLSDLTAEPERAVTEESVSTTVPDQEQREQEQEKKQEQEPESGPGKEVTYAEDTRLPKDGNGGRSSFTRSILNGLPKRPRALSGDAIANLSLKKFLPDLGSLTRRSSLSLRNSMPGQNSRPRSQTVVKPPMTAKIPPEERLTEPSEPLESEVPQRRRSASHADGARDGVVDEPISDLQSVGGSTAAKHSFSRRPSTGPGQPPLLRRTSSDHSLYLRASSTASSLDHRPQFENVHSQVNSRFKAIKDSLQDSSSRLLSMPTFNLPDIRADWGYKPFMNDVSQRKGNNYADNESSTSVHEDQQQRSPRPMPKDTLHPVLTEAMDELTGDVVVMGGYRGSILRSAKPPHRQLWVPMKVGLNLRKVDLEVGLNLEDEETMPEHVIPSGVLSHVGPVDICRRLMKRLQKCDNALNGDLRVWDYGYDWRLSPDLLSKRLIEYLQGLPCNAPGVPREKRGAYVIAHSLGGLITRHAVNLRPDLFAGVVYAGVPQHCVNILGPLRNGDDVLLSSRVLTAQVNFSFRTSFALLPEDGHCFIDKRTKEEYPVDFFSPEAWDEYRLSPCVNLALPPTTGKNFKDNLPLLAKRLSTVLSDDWDTPSSSQHEIDHHLPSSATFPQPQTHNHNHQSRQLDETQTHHNPPRTTANPLHDSQGKPSALKPTMDGLVGPTAHPRGATNVKAAATTNIPHDVAMAYLSRTLASVRAFKEALAFNPTHQSENHYPPFAVEFGKSVPTVYGARVWSREHIKHQDAYDDLAFAAGDGVCLASAAMLPPGYRIIKDGLVKSDRGHVGLLGDLEGIGQCLKAIVRGRREGVGLGAESARERELERESGGESAGTPYHEDPVEEGVTPVAGPGPESGSGSGQESGSGSGNRSGSGSGITPDRAIPV